MNRYKLELIPANDQLCIFLQRHNEKTFFQKTTDIIYEGHLPMAAYVLLKGEMQIRKGRRIARTINESNIIIGARELMNKKPFPYSISIKASSETYILCRSSLEEALKAGYLEDLKPKLHL